MTDRQKYIDGDRPTALQHRCDIVQLKYDGWWCRAVVCGGEITYFSESDRVFQLETKFPDTPPGVYIGEFMRGTQWSKKFDRHGKFFVYDIWEKAGFPLSGVYSGRYRQLRQFASSLPPHWTIVQNYRIAEKDAVWKQFVEGVEAYEGVVYRWSQGMIDYPIIREKREYTLDGIVTGFEPGEGKHAGRMGKALVLLKDGTIAKIGNGWSDDDREFAQAHPEVWIGKPLEFVCNAVFDSGNVRHGRFVRWREDKQP